jgi:cytochrome c-type biogenesis protein CcmH/NrfG
MEIMSDDKMVKQDFMIIVSLVALVAGFLIGVVFSSLQSTNPTPQVAQQQSLPPGSQGGGISPEQAGQILALENQVAANPQDLQAWTNLGNLYFDTNRFAKAINAYTRSLELDPNNADVWTDLGVMYRRSNQPDEAVKTFDRAISLTPTHEPSRFNKGLVLLNDLHDKAGARQAWEDLLTINPLAMAPNGQSVKEMLESVK